jgi:hypothetical protein
LLKVATPLAAATEVVLAVANPPGPLATLTTRVDVLDVTTLPNASSIARVRAVPKAWPAVPVLGV